MNGYQILGLRPQKWQPEDVHTSTQRHPLSNLGPAYAEAFDLRPVPRPGDNTTPNNTRANEQLEQIHGASYRHIFDLADWDRAVVTSTPGQSGQPGSPHYDDLLPLWAEGRYHPLPFTRSAVESSATDRLMLRPSPAPAKR